MLSLGACTASRSASYATAKDPQSLIEGSETANPANTINVDDRMSKDQTVADLLRRTAGVSVQGSGNDVRILIRGVNSLVGDMQPLFVVDGVTMGNSYSYVADLNAHNVRSITVVKDADAALYGSRGANGVILIRTNRNN
jgi:TonB-dependent SusC/RagA subfamily outer membrane receptor